MGFLPNFNHDTIAWETLALPDPPNISTTIKPTPSQRAKSENHESYLFTSSIPPPLPADTYREREEKVSAIMSSEPSFALKALELNNCPFYSKGDSLHVRMPGVYGGGSQFCSLPVATFIPVAMQGDKTEGVIEAGFKQCSCKWGYCKVEKMQHAMVAMEDALTAENQMGLTFLEQLPTPVVKALKDRSLPRHFEAGATILEGNAPASEFHVLIKGSARIATPEPDGRIIELNVLRRGECFGEMSILTGAATSNRVEAVDACMTLALPRAGLQKLVVDFPVLSIILYRMLSKRIRSSNQRLIQLLAPTLLGDLAHLSFIDLAQTIHTSRLNGVLRVEGKQGRVARFGFRDGHLLYSESGELFGEDAMDDVVRWNSGSFRFASGEAAPPANLDGDTMGILLETLRRLDESSILDRFDPPESQGLQGLSEKPGLGSN